MELDVLHKSQSPYIVDFYGAFFIETCVYYCMEFMDAGSLDKLYQIGVPEDILATITLSVTFFQDLSPHLCKWTGTKERTLVPAGGDGAGEKFKMGLFPV